MDEKLNRRLQYGAAGAVALSYFLPWASIMSPLGSIQFKGLYIDYAWVLLILAITHLALQFATRNRDALGLPENVEPYVITLHRIVPLLIFAFIVWQGARFSFSIRKPMGATLFGTEIGASVRAGLDYGFWLAAASSVLLIVVVSASAKQFPRFMVALLGIFVIAVGVAFGITWNSTHKQTTLGASPSGIAAQAGSPASSGGTTGESESTASSPEVDFSQTLQTVGVKARVLGKDYEASRYSAEIVITPAFRNLSSKTIVGIRGRIAVLDAFGHEAYSFGFKDDDKLASGAESRHAGGYTFEHNQFDDDDPYSKMYPLVSADNAKYSVKITAVAFADGTVLPANSSGK
jgi:hypothetical protein